jgi:hypothetical protein
VDTHSINAKAVSDMFRFAEKGKARIQQLTKECLLEVGRRLVLRSPVGDPTTWKKPYWPKGYVPGHFINNWQVGIDKIPTGTIPTVDATGHGSLERLSHLGRWQVGHTYYFVNNLPYARALEYGWSKQAPHGMVGLTVAEFTQIAEEVAARVRSGNVSG